MKNTFFYLAAFAGLTLSSCKEKDNSVRKIDNPNSFQSEYVQDSSDTKDKYLNSPVELTGTFTKNGDFVAYQYDSATDAYNYSPLVIFAGLKRDDKTVPAELNTRWYYNKETGLIVDEDHDFRIDENGVLMGQGAHLFSMEDVFRLFRDIKDGVTYTSDDLDRILYKYIKDEKLIQGIQNNQLAIHEGKTYGDLVVIDRIKVSGIVTEIKKGGDKTFLFLKDAKVISTERVFDLTSLPVVDYKEVKGILAKTEVKDSTSTDAVY